MTLPRVYALLDGLLLEKRGLRVEDAAEGLLGGGVRMLQLRWKGVYTREVFAAAERVASLCRQAGALFVVNDRADVAMLIEDAGLHVGQDDLPPLDARRLIGRSRLLGFSTHNEGQLLEAAAHEPLDYVALGPIFCTSTKANPDPVVGCDELSRLCELCRLPLVAIGGITLERAQQVWKAGAAVVAVAGDLYPERATPASIRGRAEEWVRMANEYDG